MWILNNSEEILDDLKSPSLLFPFDYKAVAGRGKVGL